MHGYYGILLDINLTDKTVNKTKIPDSDLKNYLGGRGLGAKILFDRIKPGIDPLSPDNVLLIMPGPFCGLPIPSSSRTSVVTKSPRTQPINPLYDNSYGICYSNMGGFIGPEIRFAGYDGIAITGKSKNPVYIYINDDEVEIRDADHYWGMQTDEFDKTFNNDLGNYRFESCYIGTAGEKLIPMASILNTAARASGRGGAGCVMGSKNLKAIAVKGSKMPNIKDPKTYLDLLEKIRYSFAHDNTDSLKDWREGGTANALQFASDNGYQAVKNYREATFDDIHKINTQASRKEIWSRDFACFSCQLACKKSGMAKGAYGGIIHDGPEYETGTMFGANLLISDLAGLNKLIYIADDYGIDIIAVGNTIGFLMEAYDKKLIDINFLDGIDLTWGNVDASISILHKICNRKGIGELACKGVKFLSEHIGQNSSDFAIHVKGHELAAWNVSRDPGGLGISYTTSNRGACHMNGGNKDSQNIAVICDSIGACSFATDWYKNNLAYHHFYNAITGLNLSQEEFALCGERIFNLEKMFNVREGFLKEDDILPERFYKDTFTKGIVKGQLLGRNDFEKILTNYYKSRNWNTKTSIPNKEKLIQLKLDFLL